MSVQLSIPPADPELRKSLSRDLNVSPLVAQLLINRGMTDAETARQFMRPPLGALHDPALLPGAERAAELIAEAVAAGQKITIYGDYDVDGVTGTSILWQCLRLIDADVDYYVPHRTEEGYGVNSAALEQLAADGTNLVVTVDCGITSRAEVERAAELGMRMIVTDHHEPEPELPAAECVVHPRLDEGAYPFGDLSGAGVALKVAWALGQRLSGSQKVSPEFRDFLVASVAMAALGTVADVVPLVDENRVLVHHGLKALAAAPTPGIAALIEVCQLNRREMDAMDIGFQLAPRLNAVGRLGHARLAIELLTTEDADRAGEIARFLDDQNKKRRTLQQRIFREARARVEEELDLDATPAICLAGEGWHAGVVGIVANRLVETFGRPTILVALDGESGQGSGRSIPGFNLLEAVRTGADELTTFGGHAHAAGLRVAADRFEAFREKFYEAARGWIEPKDLVMPIQVDAEVPLGILNVAAVRELNYLAPFGRGNPAPVLVSRPVDVVGVPRQVGGGGRHLSFMVRQDGGSCKAIAFGMGDRLEELLALPQCQLVYRPTLNHWQGRTSVDLQVEHLHVLP